MAKRQPAWVKEVEAFGWFTLLNFVLGVVGSISISLLGPMVGGLQLLLVWWWVIATPAMIARELGWMGASWALLFLNPLIYGLMWWSVWRAIKVFRAKPAD